ncbi:MAG TPA: MFS transporter [Actinospica sp.]|nr:MFS transporter [Actinospica sp.]
MRRAGLLSQLRRPPGGRDARIMIGAGFLDRTGTGVWNAASVLYFTVEAGFDARRIGLLLGLGGVAGVFGSPVAGRLAARHPERTVLVGCHLLRLLTLSTILCTTSFAVLLPVVALTVFGDRAAKMLEMLFATEVAGPQRATYQALFRSVSNAGYALGAGIAAIGLAIGTADAYRVLILLDALSFAVIAVLVRRIHAGTDARGAAAVGPANATTTADSAPGPWRDAGYLGFVGLDVFMTTDDPVLNVGLPLWLLTRTSAPHGLIPVFLVVNTLLVVALQMRVSAATHGPYAATTAVGRYGLIMFGCCLCLAAAAECGPLLASLALLTAAALQTLAELMRSVSSWELAVSLAPAGARPAYLGVAGMSQSTQKCLGPLLLTGVVMAAGPVGWLGLGGLVAAASAAQRRNCLRRLDRSPSAPSPRPVRDTAQT